MILHWLRTMVVASVALAPMVQAQDLMDTLPRDASGRPLVVSQVMVLFRAGVEPRPRAMVSEAIMKRLSRAAGVEIKPGRLLPEEDWQLLQLPAAVTEDESEVIANKLKTLAIVLDAWPNEPTQIISPPGKPQYLKFLDEEPDKSRFMRWFTFNVPNVETMTVKFKGPDGGPATELASKALVAEISRIGGVTLSPISESLDSFLKSERFKFQRRMTQSEAEAICARIERHPKVEYCSAPGPVYAMAVTTNDPELGRQWGLLSNTYGGARVDQAWSTTTGTDAVIAVLDTGRLAHTELTGRYLPGYDFITDPRRSGDGDGRDANPEDRGSWIREPEVLDTTGIFYNCVDRQTFSLPPSNPPNPYLPPAVLTELVGGQNVRYLTSDWHGTHVAGTIAATTNNGGRRRGDQLGGTRVAGAYAREVRSWRTERPIGCNLLVSRRRSARRRGESQYRQDRKHESEW